MSVIDLARISLRNLQNNDHSVSESLYEACREYGFFLLDLEGSEEGERLLKDAEKMFDLTAAMLELDGAVLDKFAYNAPKKSLRVCHVLFLHRRVRSRAIRSIGD